MTAAGYLKRCCCGSRPYLWVLSGSAGVRCRGCDREAQGATIRQAVGAWQAQRMADEAPGNVQEDDEGEGAVADLPGEHGHLRAGH